MQLMKYTRVRSAVVAVGLVLVAAGQAVGQNTALLQAHGDTLTSYPAAVTAAQGVKPLFTQRGTGLDGSVRGGSGLSVALAANPFGDPGGGSARLGDMTLWNGSYAPFDVDWTGPASGAARWVIGRTYNQLQASTSNGYQGKNWFQMSQPEIVLYTHSSDASKDVLVLVYGADRYAEFQRTGSTASTFKGKNGAAGVFERVAGTGGDPDTYVHHDPSGTRTYFFGGNTSSGQADWQLWKIVDAADNMAYVGHATNASTAVSNGYNTDQSIKVAYDAGTDSDGRRYSYTYAGSRLTEVKVEIKAGGSWASPAGLQEVARITYEYYAGSSSNGPEGYLASVKVRTTLTDSGATLGSGVYMERSKHYRYYTEAWANSDGRRGGPGMLKMVVGHEGCRKFDWDEDPSESRTMDGSWASATDAALKPFAEAYLEYPSATDWRPSKAFFNGECGCSGGTNGTYEFTYEQSSSYGTYTGNTSYDNSWATRTIVKRPDGTYATMYFDELGQGLSSAVTNTNPTGSPGKLWATKVERNADGQVIRVYSPANATAYTHSTGAITSSSSSGLVTVYERVASGDMKGLVSAVRIRDGHDGTLSDDSTATYLSATEYTSTVYTPSGWSGVSVIRALTDKQRSFHTAGTSSTSNNDETTMSYVMHGTSATDIKNLVLKEATTVLPAIGTDKNGRGTGSTNTVKASRFMRKDGTIAFTREAAFSDEISTKQVVDYQATSRGLPTSSIRDAKTDGSFPSEDAPYASFGLSENASGLNIQPTTSPTFDYQSRPDTTTVATLAAARTTKAYYSRLADGRMVTIQLPKYTTTGTPTAYGPASYVVTNHAGKAEFSATLALPSSGVSAALSTWIDNGDSDPITAIKQGTIASMSTSVYSDSGNQLLESRAYFLIPPSSPGTEGTHYDSTRYAYDSMGRTRRVKQASGTITTSTFDELGRTIERHLGTNDADEAGTDNMVKVEAIEYDAGLSGGNGHVTKRTAYVEDSATGQRVTNFTYDFRGRMILQENPQAPHSLTKYDNLGRVVARGQYTSISGLSATSDPASVTTNRSGFAETLYDQQGRVYKSTIHKINQSSGASEDTLDSLTWYDAAGRVIKTKGPSGIAKTLYDRAGRATHRFTIGSDGGETDYADMDDAAFDTVLEESQTWYDNTTSLALVQATIQRWHDDYGGGATSGALNTNPNATTISEGNIKGRISISAMWYDELLRVTDTAAYGTNGFTGSGSGTYTRASSPPDRSDTVLRTTNTYDTAGRLSTVEAPGQPDDPSTTGTTTAYFYDALGRVTAEVRNWTNASTPITTAERANDLYTRTVYEKGLRTKLWVDLNGNGSEETGDQVTVYTYGTTKGTSAGDSKVATEHLLQKVTYPDSSGSTDVVTFAYNAQGQQIWTKDQSGTVIETDYDTGGRQTHRRVTTFGTNIDDAVKRISTTYLSRGLVDKVTQYDNATAGSGTALDQVQYSYDGWGNLSMFEQDVDSTISGGSGRASFPLTYSYAKVTPTGGWPQVRVTSKSYAGHNHELYYGSSGTSIDNLIGRCTETWLNNLSENDTILTTYEYLGVASLVGTGLYQADVVNRLYVSGSPRAYGRLDRFGRVTRSVWEVDGGSAFYDTSIAYDRLSGIISTDDAVPYGKDAGEWADVRYGLDATGRLKDADEGHLVSGSIGSTTRKRRESWFVGSTLGLSQAGNWNRRRLDLNGDSDYTDAGELDDTGTFNAANEWLTRDTDSNSSANYTLAHDTNGNLTDDGANYKFKYDAFGRLRKVINRSTDTDVAVYRYNGLGYRIMWQYNVDGDIYMEDDERFYFAYDERWRMLATYRNADSDPKERFFYHMAGLAGMGGSSYIDSVVLRDRDKTNGWGGAADGTLEDRVYYAQNWRADVVATFKPGGAGGIQLHERIKYDSYGRPRWYFLDDYDHDGGTGIEDMLAYLDDFENIADGRVDTNFDGGAGIEDMLDYLDAYENPRGTDNRKLYAGYEWDFTTGYANGHYHVRHRVLLPELGRWSRRDPLGYVDGMSAYSYVASAPIDSSDSLGLQRSSSDFALSPVDIQATIQSGNNWPDIHTMGRCIEWRPKLIRALAPGETFQIGRYLNFIQTTSSNREGLAFDLRLSAVTTDTSARFTATSLGLGWSEHYSIWRGWVRKYRGAPYAVATTPTINVKCDNNRQGELVFEKHGGTSGFDTFSPKMVSGMLADTLYLGVTADAYRSGRRGTIDVDAEVLYGYSALISPSVNFPGGFGAQLNAPAFSARLFQTDIGTWDWDCCCTLMEFGRQLVPVRDCDTPVEYWHAPPIIPLLG